MPLLQEEIDALKQQGCPNPMLWMSNGPTEFYTGYSTRPEVTHIGGNKFFVSQELRNLLPLQQELDAYITHRVAKITNQSWSTVMGIVTGAVVFGTVKGVSKLTENPVAIKTAVKLRNLADELDGKTSNPSVLSRRQWNSGVLGAIAGVLSGGSTKMALDRNAANIEGPPELVSALRKVDEWYKYQRPSESAISSDMRWQDSLSSPRGFDPHSR